MLDLEKKLQINQYLGRAEEYYNLASLSVGIYFLDETEDNDFRYGNDDIYHIASVSKILTGTCLAKLVEQGDLSWGARLVDVVPSIPVSDELKHVKIIDMCSHISGFPDGVKYNWDKPRLASDALREYVHSEVYEGMGLNKAIKMENNGNNFQFFYSNLAYEVLGFAISKLSNESYEDFVEQNIFSLANMHKSTMKTFERTAFGKGLDKRLAQEIEQSRCTEVELGLKSLDFKELSAQACALPHLNTKSAKADAAHTAPPNPPGSLGPPNPPDSPTGLSLAPNYPYNREHAPSSTLTSTVTDLGRLARAYSSDVLLGEKALDLMLQPRAKVHRSEEDIGISWFIREQNGHKLYGHEGADTGFRSSFYICPSLRVATAVLSNTDKAPLKKISKYLINSL